MSDNAKWFKTPIFIKKDNHEPVKYYKELLDTALDSNGDSKVIKSMREFLKSRGHLTEKQCKYLRVMIDVYEEDQNYPASFDPDVSGNYY